MPGHVRTSAATLFMAGGDAASQRFYQFTCNPRSALDLYFLPTGEWGDPARVVPDGWNPWQRAGLVCRLCRGQAKNAALVFKRMLPLLLRVNSPHA